jgi:hypothetical protein
MDASEPVVLAIVALAAIAVGHVLRAWFLPLALVSVFGALIVLNSFHQPLIGMAESPLEAYLPLNANGSLVWAPEPARQTIIDLRKFQAANLRMGETMLIAPHWPMAYALLRLRSPIWEIYHLSGRTADFQRAEIADLERRQIRFAVFGDAMIDERSDRRMSVHEPLLYRYLTDNYAPLDTPLLPEPYQVYRRTTPFAAPAAPAPGRQD